MATSMPRVTINDHVTEARPGENVLRLARRDGLHIWFLCDGRGLCRTCECRVLAGGDNLCPPSTIERESLSEARRAEGYRLACQATVQGPGEIDMISTVERMRRHGTSLDLRELLSELSRFSIDFSSSLPESAVNALPQLIAMPPTLPRVQRYVRDGLRMIVRLI